MSRRTALHATRRGGPYDARYQKLRRILIAQHPWCTDCGSRDRTTVDHIIRVRRGGWSVPDNLEVVCFPCNLARRDAELEAEGRRPFTRRPNCPPRPPTGALTQRG